MGRSPIKPILFLDSIEDPPMKDWMSITIAFLGGLAVALITFLVFQSTGDPHKKNERQNSAGASTKKTSPKPAANESHTTESDSATSTKTAASGTTNSRRESNSKDGWSKKAKKQKLPRLLFFSIPT